MSRLAFTFLILIFIVSCKPQQPYDLQRVDALRAQAESLYRVQMKMGYESWVHGASSNQDSLYKANADLFLPENIELLKKAWSAETDSVQKQRLWYFLRYLSTEYIAKQLAPLTDQISNIEASATVKVDNKEIAYRQVPGMIANEESQRERAALYTSMDPVLDSLNVILAHIEITNQRLAKELGYVSYTDMVAQLKQFPLQEFRGIAERVLEETETLYTSLLGEMVGKELKLKLDHFYRHDTGMLLRNKSFDRYFPAANMMDALRKTYRGLGIDPDTLGNLTIDADQREEKNPRAVCFPIDVPNDVRLSIKPIGGFDDYSALFHEAGHGFHYAFTRENAFEFKYLGDPTVTETFAFLSEYILTNQAWLRMHSTMPAPVLKDFVRSQAFKRLYMIRRYCAKFLYELELHSGASNAEELYARYLGNATGYRRHPSDGKRYMADVDALYYVASYLRAWFLEAQLNARLTKDYGVNWFENPEAGTFLQSLWARGDRVNADELARSLGSDDITPDTLLEHIKMMILLSTKPAR